MTNQVSENFIIDGEYFPIASCPEFPINNCSIRERLEPDNESPFVSTTACWRRYIGTWELKDGQLFLLKLSGLYEIVDEQPLFAEWFSGDLLIPHDEGRFHFHKEFGSTHDVGLHMNFSKGYLKKTKLIDKPGRQ